MSSSPGSLDVGVDKPLPLDLESPSSTSPLIHHIPPPVAPSPVHISNTALTVELKSDARSYSTFTSSSHAVSSSPSSSSFVSESKATDSRFCEMCLEDVLEGHVLQDCKHFSCSSCLTAYLQSCLKDQSAYPVLCYRRPQCKTPLTYSDVSQHLSPEELSVYDKFSIRAAFKETSTTCPRQGCGALIILDTPDFEQAVNCVACGFEFCAHCQVGWHRGKTCAQFAATRANAEEDSRNVARLQALAGQEHWFACPTCKMLIERTGGCNHLTHLASQGCTIQGADATHFCSLCGLVLGGTHHKTEQDTGLDHFPSGLFEKCRTVLEKEAGGAKKLAALRKKQEKEARRRDPLRRWQNSLFRCGCSSECRIACCCPCWMGAHTATAVNGRSAKGPCLAYCCCPCVYGPYRRYSIRQQFGIRSWCPIIADICVFCTCPCLSILQESRELEARANVPATMFMT